VASTKDCSRALRGLAKRLADVDGDLRRKHAVDRTISCRISDLQTDFSGRISDGELVDVKQEALPDAQIKLSLTSDDLVALTDGQLNVASAWATGRLRVDASIKDMLRLRALL
jgi:putative sterol carrier protein